MKLYFLCPLTSLLIVSIPAVPSGGLWIVSERSDLFENPEALGQYSNILSFFSKNFRTLEDSCFYYHLAWDVKN